MDRKALGALGEEKVCEHLIKNGWEIIERNYFIRGGEIDIIARCGEDIAFVEVKARKSDRYGTPAEAVGFKKRAAMVRCAGEYIAKNNLTKANVTFDVAEVKIKGSDAVINYIRNAFYE